MKAEPAEFPDKRRWPAWGLAVFWIAVLTVTALPRWAYLDREVRHLDENIVLTVSEHLARGDSWDTNWSRAGVGFGYRENQYNFSAYLYATHLFARVTGPLWPEAWRTQWRGVRVHRAFSALCGTLAAVFVAALAWSLAGPVAAGAAAAAYAVTPQLVQDAHYARPEAFVTLGTAVVAWLCLAPLGHERAREAWWPVWLAAGLVGLLTATKITLGALMVLPLWAGWRVWQAGRRTPGATGGRPSALREGLALTGVLLAWVAGLFLGMPYAFFDPAAYWEGVMYLREQYGGFHPPHNRLDGGRVWPLLTAYYGAVLGWLPVALAVVGACALAVRRQWGALILLTGLVAFYIAYFGQQRVFFERNLAHVLPLAAVLFGTGAVAVGRWFGRGGAAVAAGLAVLALLPAADITERLVTRGFSGDELRRAAHFQAALSAQQPGMEVLWVTFMGPETFRHIDAVVGRGQPLLLAVNDFNDDLSARLLPEVRRRYYAEEIMEHRGAFWWVPVSTLNVYHGHRVRVFRIQGPRVSLADR